MRVFAVLIGLFAIFLSACTPPLAGKSMRSQKPASTHISQLNTPPKWSIPRLNAPPNWSVGCDAKKKDQFGDSKRRYCWLRVDNLASSAQIMDDNSYVMKLVTIMEIDAGGITLSTPKAALSCSGGPKRIAVDGIRIDDLPTVQQINAISKGRKLTWEEQAAWPYCGVAPHGTYLDGVGPAIAELKEKWAEVSR